MKQFDLIAVGGGTAGLVTAVGASSLGLKVALVEREALGGDCLWTGCVPSKALLASAKLAHHMRHAERLGLTGASPAHAFERVMGRMRAARARIAEHDDPERFRKLGIDVRFGEARLDEGKRVSVDGQTLHAPRVVIATGAVPAVPPFSGLDETGYLTYETAFDQNDLPGRIGILGAGPIGVEFAQIYNRLGAQVTVFEMLPRVLPSEDADASAVLHEALHDECITVHTHTRVDRIQPDANGGGKVIHASRSDGAPLSVTVDEVFVATGRHANTRGLGLDELGVKLERGAIKVDASLRSSVPGIWAAGDVAGGPQFTHVADYQAKLVIRNAIFPLHAKADYSAVPIVTYTDPEVARVGLTEQEAKAHHGDVTVYRYNFDDLDRAIVEGETRGFTKVVTKPNGKILGATVVASGAGDLLMPLVLAMSAGLPLPKLSRVVYPYPTMVEGVKRTADSYYRTKLAGRTGDFLRTIAGWLT